MSERGKARVNKIEKEWEKKNKREGKNEREGGREREKERE